MGECVWKKDAVGRRWTAMTRAREWMGRGRGGTASFIFAAFSCHVSMLQAKHETKAKIDY